MKILKHLTCVRHGQSEGNVRNVREGAESPLSKLGLRQAHLVAERFDTMKVEALFASNYIRAEQTADIIGERKNIAVQTEPRAHERKVPSFIVSLPKDDPQVVEFMNTMWTVWETDREERFEDGESLADVFGRVSEVLHMIHDRPETHITLVSHEFFLKAMHAYVVYGKNPTSEQMRHIYQKYRLSNTSLTHFVFTAEHGWQLITWNDNAHLAMLIEHEEVEEIPESQK